MELKPVFEGRPRLDAAVRWTAVVSLPIVLIAAILDRDPRQIVVVVALAALAAQSLLVLPPPVERALNVLFWVGIAAWVVLVAR